VTGIDPYARSLVLWMLGLAAVIYAVKIVWSFAVPSVTRPYWLRIPLRVETFLVGMATLLLVIAPVHMAEWHSADEVLDRWSRFLPYTATIAFAAGFLSGAIDRARPIALGLSMAWPSAFYAAMAWALFLLIGSWVPPEDVPNATEFVTRATPFLALVTGFPVSSLLCGIVGGSLGGLLGRRLWRP
jgi:hypothetical protein